MYERRLATGEMEKKNSDHILKYQKKRNNREMNSALADTFPSYWATLIVLGGRIQAPGGHPHHPHHCHYC